MVDRGGIERPAQGAVHHVVALGPVLAAHVLDSADVAALDDHLGGVVVTLEDGAEVRARAVAGEGVGVVGRAGEQDRRTLCPPGNEDDGVELHPVPHRDHHVAPDVVESVRHRLELRRRLAGKGGLGGGARGRRPGGLGGPRPDEEHARQRREQGQHADVVDELHGSTGPDRVGARRRRVAQRTPRARAARA